jgi:NADH-quinone oxidoreductase subunit C
MTELVRQKLEEIFPDAIVEVVEFRGERTFVLDKDDLLAVCQFLRDDEALRYAFLADIVADDMLPEYPRFAVNYHLRSFQNKDWIRLRVPVEDPDEGPPSLGALWPVATWLETEVWDLMGVRFEGNESLRRLFLPEDWVGHPLRKDYPLGYEEVQFSFNWEAIDAKKPYAKD